MSITIRDIAKKLDLSIAAVSRALDGYSDISGETRQRVIKAAAEMGYSPNRSARQLRRKKADAIGYILPTEEPRFADPFVAEFISGLGNETALHPFDLLISIAPPGLDTEQTLYRNWVQSQKVDGFILNRMRVKDWRVQYLYETNIPFTALELSLDSIDYPRVEVDNENAMASLVKYLTKQGFQRFAFIGGDENLIKHKARFGGFLKGLEYCGIEWESGLSANGDMTIAGGYRIAQKLLYLKAPPDAILCINDETALGVLRAAHERGVEVGKQLAVTGFEGVIAGRYSEPSLTTMDIPIYEIARILVKMLACEIMHDVLDERVVVVKPEMILRQSTGRMG
jgi:LacI family transcriptional regulator